ncbi:hypothetical protein FRB93_000165 [Tulasnella sp. JGI-2019a]|nr:hypothetical protein FRB93_000165 [Tulasnella sp. JGI-2019a]
MTPELDARIQELESTNASLSCQVPELETELCSLRETAFSRLTENVDMRNRRARLKRDLQQAQAKLAELQSSYEEAEAQMDKKTRKYEAELIAMEGEMTSERRKNKKLKDLAVKLVMQRDDALSKLASITGTSPVRLQGLFIP